MQPCVQHKALGAPAQHARLCTCAHQTPTEVEADVSDMPATICARLQAQQSDVACVGFGADGQIPNRSSGTVDTVMQAGRGGRGPNERKFQGEAVHGRHSIVFEEARVG